MQGVEEQLVKAGTWFRGSSRAGGLRKGFGWFFVMNTMQRYVESSTSYWSDVCFF